MIFDRISDLCAERNISITKLEEETGLGNATIRKWKTSWPNVDKLRRVADYFGVTIDSLIRETPTS